MKKSCLAVLCSCLLTLTFLATSAMSCEEGCTPGFWKNHNMYKNTDHWCESFTPDMSYNGVFLVTAGWDDDPTLLDALKCGGGGEKAMARHAVAALLNACSEEVDALGSSNEEWGVNFVIENVQDAYATERFQYWKDKFAAWNEDNPLGCPL